MERTISVMVGKGSQSHNNRSFIAKNVDAARVSENVIYVKKNIRKLYHELFDEALEEYNAKQTRKDRRIKDYYKKLETGKQEKPYHEIILQIGNKDDMSAKDPENVELAKEIFAEYIESFQERNPNMVVFNAVLHVDEASPHVHIDFVPVMHNSKRGLRTRNSMKGALEEMGFHGEGKGNTEWSKWAESEKKVLADIMQRYDIGWKQLGTHEEHLDVLDYKKKMRTKEVKELDEAIEQKSEALVTKDKFLEQKNQQVRDAYSELRETSEQIENAQKLLRRKELEIDEADGVLSDKRSEIDEAQSVLVDKKNEADEVQKLLDSRKAEAAVAEANLENISSEVAQKKEELRSVEDAVSDYVLALRNTTQDVSEATHELEKLKEERSNVFTEVAEAKREKKQIQEDSARLVSEVEALMDEKDRLEKTIYDASKSAISYQHEIERLDGPKWSLSEPSGFVSAKAFFKDVAFPLVKSLKDWIKSLLANVKVLESKVKELTEYKAWAEKKIKAQHEDELQRQKEFDTLMKDLEDYNLLKIAFGPDRMYELLMKALDIYYEEHGIPYNSAKEIEQQTKTR